jgi:membrane-associated PAP2 superfamily phosphatase
VLVVRRLRHVLIGLGATAALTVLFWVTDLDLRWQALAYSPVEPHWPHGGARAWALVYRLGTLPGLAVGVLAAVGLGLSFVKNEFVRWRYPCLFLVLLLALGPGLVINVLAKGFWGRPRPDQILEFGGLLQFRHPFEPGLAHKGFSFLCGHCSMGFLFMGLFFLLRGWKRWACLLAGFLFGTVQGIGRMVQGAHFASDALLGASVMFTLAAALAPVASWQPRTGAERRHRLRVAGATALLIVLIVGGFLFSMPVREENVCVWLEPGKTSAAGNETVLRWRANRDGPSRRNVLVAVEVGDVMVEIRRQPEPLVIRSLVTGFAFPGSGSHIATGELAHEEGISYRQSLSGFFVEKHGTFHVILRDDLAASLKVKTGDGQVILVGPLPARPLAVTGNFDLSDPSRLLRPAGVGWYTSPGEGTPIALTLEAEKVLVRP